MRGIRRLVVLVIATAVAFAFAVVRFESAAEEGCAQRAGTDPSYRVHLRQVERAAEGDDMGGMAGTGEMDMETGDDMAGMDMGGMAAPGPTTYRLRVLHDGRPVQGARVCMGAFMRGMSAMAVVGEAEETAAGTYELTVDYAMGGEWSARVVVDEPGRAPAAVTFDLTPGA